MKFKTKICTIQMPIVMTLLLFSVSLVTHAQDPTRPQIPSVQIAPIQKSAVKKQQQPLTAIISKNNQRIAMIEGKFYKKGEYYRGKRIVNIYHDKVLLSSNSGNSHLTLIPKIKK